MEELDKDLVQAFSKLVDDPAMKAISAKLQEMSENIPKEPIYYAQFPNHAHVFSGYHDAIREINNFILKYMEYAIQDKQE